VATEKPIVRASVLTYRGIAPGATHWIGFLKNETTGEDFQQGDFTDETAAVKWAVAKFFELYNTRTHILFVGSQTDYLSF
jgi:hypothetical protein